jgi:hypothetical protein
MGRYRMGRVLNDYREFVAGLVGLIVFVLGLLVIGAAVVQPRTEGITPQVAAQLGDRWPGTPDSCVTDETVANCYREPVQRDAILKQPYSVVSALGYSVVGLIILWLVGRERVHRGREANPMTGQPFYKGALGWVALAMGPGAMIYHATVTHWGGVFDQMSMYMLLAFMTAYNFVVVTRWTSQKAAFLTGYLLVLGWGFVAAVILGGSVIIFLASAVLVGAWELASFLGLRRWTGRVRDPLSFWLGAIGLLGIAIVVWLFSNPNIAGRPVTFPWHLIWHLTSAAFILGYFMYLRTEEPATA